MIAEAIGHTLAPSPFLSSAVIAAHLIGHAGSDAQRSRWLPKLADGSLIAALAVDETAKHQPHRITLGAQSAPGGYRLTGAKTFVIDGHVADLLLVVARTAGEPEDTQGVSVFAVPADAPGVTVERTVMVDAHNAARVTLERISARPMA